MPSSNPGGQSSTTLSRWQLILGRHAEQHLPGGRGGEQQRLEQTLDWLYSREYRNRGMRGEDEAEAEAESGGGGDEPGVLRQLLGGLGPSALTVPKWLDQVKELFPQEACEILQQHALTRYGLTELVTDPEVLERIEASMDLVKLLLTFRGMLKGPALAMARRKIREVVDDLMEQLRTEVIRAFSTRKHRFTHSPLRIYQNLDWRDTIRRNLKHWDAGRKQLIIQELRFFSRVKRRLPWTVILCVDQSGSMADSVIHSAVMAGILTALPFIQLKLIVFDTNVVDLTEHADDPVEVLMTIQLGGGTDIGKAVAYGESLIVEPQRTVFVLLSDFCEGADPGRLLAAVQRMHEAGVTLLGLASLDMEAAPWYDKRMAERLLERGMEIAALTPNRLAQWLATKLS